MCNCCNLVPAIQIYSLTVQYYILGYRTGYTKGVIQNANVVLRIQDRFHFGLFQVVSDGGPFADIGDSGSLIVDEEHEEILGIIVALNDYCENNNQSVYCVRLDYMLCHAKSQWHKLLSLNDADEGYDIELKHFLVNLHLLFIED